MEFYLLGPLSVRSRQSYFPVGSGRNRKLLAALLLNANRPVSTDRLVDVVWDDDPPATARQQVQNCIGTLRRILIEGGCRVVIHRQATSYTIEVSDEMVDVSTFHRHCVMAEQLSKRGRPSEAVLALRVGLQLWRGAALQDVDSAALVADSVRLEETRLQAIRALIDLEFAQGNQASMIGDLSTWADAYPFHEELHCRLAEALHQVSRTADAARALQSLRRRLATELGIGVGAQVHEIEQRILGRSQDASLGTGGIRLDHDALRAISSALRDISMALHVLLPDDALPCAHDRAG